MKTPQQVADWQRRVRACPKVWAVQVIFEGEYSIEDVYDTSEAAQVHAFWINSRKPRLGRASVVPLNLQTEALARERFEMPVPTSAETVKP